MPIRILDATTVGKIAAGEVVERPSSIAKELVENSLDAGATSIAIELREGGISYLRVTDNGCGIPAGEVRLAFENHATSKIAKSDDLLTLRTLGFRGEALPSIAAVSKVEMQTRTKGAEQGMRALVEGGAIVSLESAGCAEGTTIVVRDLFYNVPARQAFLKKPAYEYGAVNEVVTRLALGNPKVAFRLIHNGKTIFSTYGDGNLRHAAMAVYDRETANGMLEIDEAEGGFHLRGLIGVGEFSKQTRAFECFFINGRSVRCQLIAQALEACAQGRVMVGKYPMCILNISMPPNSVDVNVHPNKLEVRFKSAYDVRRTMEALLYRAFQGETMLSLEEETVDGGAEAASNANQTEVYKNSTSVCIETSAPSASINKTDLKQTIDYIRRTPVFSGQPMTLREMREAFFAPKAPAQAQEPEVTKTPFASQPVLPLQEVAKSPLQEETLSQLNAGTEVQVQEMVQKPPKEESPVQQAMPTGPAYRVLGVVFKTYILLETADSLIVIDQHAAFERLKYEEYVRLLEGGNASQQLLVANIMRVSARERADLLENQALLRELGFEIEPFGEADVKISAVPYVLGHTDPQPLLHDVLANLHSLRSANLAMRRKEILQMSCKHAVKAGDVLTREAIDELVETMLVTGAPPFCPHGRPVAKRLTKRDMEQMFKRV